MIERRRYPRYLVQLPVEYWETEDAVMGGTVFNVSETGLLIYSMHDMAIGTELTIRLYYSFGDDFETVQSLAKIIWKDFRQDKSQQRYKYGLGIIQMSPQDRQKLKQWINIRRGELLSEGAIKETVRAI